MADFTIEEHFRYRALELRLKNALEMQAGLFKIQGVEPDWVHTQAADLSKIIKDVRDAMLVMERKFHE